MAYPHVCRPTPDTASDCGNAVAGHEATIALMSSVRTASPLGWLVLLILLCAQSAVADVITGRVVKVHDGDTLTVPSRYVRRQGARRCRARQGPLRSHAWPRHLRRR